MGKIISSMIQIRFAPIYLSCTLCFFGLLSRAVVDDDGYVAVREEQYVSGPVLGRTNSITRRVNFINSHVHYFDFSQDHDVECTICMEYFETDLEKPIAELGCNKKHIFHKECIEKWAKEHGTCPICRKEIGND